MKKIYNPIVIILILSTVFFSCRKEINQIKNESTSLTIEQAKQYLHKDLKVNSEDIRLSSPLSKSQLVMNQGKNLKEEKIMGSVFWEKAVAYELEQSGVVEAPFLAKNKIVSLYNITGDPAISENAKWRAEASYTNLMIYTRVNGEMASAFVTYIPDGHLMEKGARARTTVNNIGKSFWGYVEYKDWDQNTMMILRVEAGKVKSRFKMRKNLVSNLNSEDINVDYNIANSCIQVCTPIYQTICSTIEGFFEEVCVTQQIGENCEYVCAGGGDPDDPPSSGGGDDPVQENPDVLGTIA